MNYLLEQLQQSLHITPTMLNQLNKLSLQTTYDVLFHLPRDYEDKHTIITIRDAQVGCSVLLAAIIQNVEFFNGKRASMAVTISDGTGNMLLRYYHVYPTLIQKFPIGQWIHIYGEVRIGAKGREIYHPEWIEPTSLSASPQQLTAIYPSTEQLKQTQLRQLVDQCLAQYANDLHGLIPNTLHPHYHVKHALTLIHHPPIGDNVTTLKAGKHTAIQCLVIEELTAHQLSLLQRRLYLQQDRAVAIQANLSLVKQLLAQLPFSPTHAQQRVFQEIRHDLQKNKPMLRLVQGDVGAGKTLVAAMATAFVLQQREQVALMAPTEILAEQHYLNFKTWFEPLNIQVVFLASKLKIKEKRHALAQIQTGQANIVIGTHALFQEQVQFAQLALVIIDEQHRFGVEQRLALRHKGYQTGLGYFSPHQLVMTATPIPRTLAMSVYGDLDTSIIDELPPNRSPVQTVAMPIERRDEVLQRIIGHCRQGKQAYWVCTLVQESETLDAQAAEVFFRQIQQQYPDLKVGLVHGKMKAEEKQQIMQQFQANHLQCLIATTVIEVGVDVPNASIMVIENTERFGLSQLHQLRGRVGRGSTQSFCVLLYKSPLSYQGQSRLDILRRSNNGFEIAQHDLALRGAGDILGCKQAGDLVFKIADLKRDEYLLDKAHHIAKQMMINFPKESQALIQRWLPDVQQYVAV